MPLALSQEAHRLSYMPFTDDLFRQFPARPKIAKWFEAIKSTTTLSRLASVRKLTVGLSLWRPWVVKLQCIKLEQLQLIEKLISADIELTLNLIFEGSNARGYCLHTQYSTTLMKEHAQPVS